MCIISHEALLTFSSIHSFKSCTEINKASCLWSHQGLTKKESWSESISLFRPQNLSSLVACADMLCKLQPAGTPGGEELCGAACRSRSCLAPGNSKSHSSRKGAFALWVRMAALENVVLGFFSSS